MDKNVVNRWKGISKILFKHYKVKPKKLYITTSDKDNDLHHNKAFYDLYNRTITLNLDKAESFEDIMNTVRGDNQPMEARVNELAGLVGEKDAKKTPKSVLTVMQPYFQILDVVQAQATPGGIADLPMKEE